MIINLNQDQVLTLLQIVQGEHMNLKKYFKECPNGTEGLTTPEEVAEIYNCILKQV